MRRRQHKTTLLGKLLRDVSERVSLNIIMINDCGREINFSHEKIESFVVGGSMGLADHVLYLMMLLSI